MPLMYYIIILFLYYSHSIDVYWTDNPFDGVKGYIALKFHILIINVIKPVFMF